MKRIVPVQKCIQSPLKRVRMVCIAENGQYTSTDSFKYCSRVIHREMQLAFDYHSLRHTHATLLIESGADVKDVQTRLDIPTSKPLYRHMCMILKRWGNSLLNCLNRLAAENTPEPPL